MGKITVNFAEVESGFEAIEEGPYPVVIEKVEVRESKSSDHPYLNWELTITDGDHEGRKLWQITSLSPNALFRLKDQLIALGVIEGDEEIDLDWDDDVEVTPKAGPMLLEPDVVGLAAIAIVTVEPYKGVNQNRVEVLQAAEGDRPRKASSAKASASSTSSTASKPAKRRALR